MTAQYSNEITISERLNEIAEILAAGLMRLRAEQSSPLSRDFGESSLRLSRPTRAVIPQPKTGECRMTDTVLAQLAALKTAPIGALKQKWRDLFESEPPPYNRRFLEHRLAYRIQELAYGGLKPETLKRLASSAKNSTAAIRRGAGSRRRTGRSPARG